MTQHQSNKFHLPFYFRFGSSNLFSPAKLEFWPAFWPLAARCFESCFGTRKPNSAKFSQETVCNKMSRFQIMEKLATKYRQLFLA